MRCRFFAVMSIATACVVLSLPSCGDDGTNGAPDRGKLAQSKTPAVKRALRRAYDGAPPTIPHADFGSNCTSCHNAQGLHVPDVGFAPPMPHAQTAGLSSIARCKQCHVYKSIDEVFKKSDYTGFPQDLRSGKRQHSEAPPVIPHPVFMRENCQACHSGLAAREEIRCSHPERVRCVQCHLEQSTTETDSFQR